MSGGREREARKGNVSSRCYVLSRVECKIEVDKINCITMLMSEHYSIELTEQSTRRERERERERERSDGRGICMAKERTQHEKAGERERER